MNPDDLMPPWRLVHTPPLDGAMNMAVDVALMERARQTGEAVFRIYTWARPTLSLGRNQTAVGRYALDRIRAQGAGVVRRPTGGRAILHWREITYSVTAPATDAVGLRQSYERINRILVDGLRRLGVATSIVQPGSGSTITSTSEASQSAPATNVQERIATSPRAERPSTIPCFATPSAGEMTADGRKLVGSAQWRDDGALLQHGSILLEDDQSLLASLMVEPQAPIARPGTLTDILGRSPSAEEVADAMFSAVRNVETPHATVLDPGEVMALGHTALDQFLDHEWTWRR